MGFQELALLLGYLLGLLALTHLKINSRFIKFYELFVRTYLFLGIGLAFYISSFVLVLFVLLFGAFLLNYIFIQKFSLVVVVIYSLLSAKNDEFLNNDHLMFLCIVMSINVLNLFISEQIDGFYERAYKESNRCQVYSAELRKQRDLLEVKVQERTQELQESRKADILKLNQMANLGKLSAGLTHEIVNPLTYIKFNLSLIKNEAKSEAYIAKAIKGVGQIDLLLQSFRKQLLNSKEKNLFEVKKEIEGALALVHYKALKYKVGVHAEVDHARLYGSSVKFNQVIVNLLTNAIDACESSEPKDVKISACHRDGKYILQVEDSGLGIREKDREKIFEPLFTTKNIERGTGLGLSICKQIIEDDFGGSFSLRSPKGPTIFEIALPLP